MKKHRAVYLFLSILEGMISGVYFYLAQEDKRPLDLLTGILWLACSFCHGLLSIRDPEDDILVTEEFDYE